MKKTTVFICLTIMGLFFIFLTVSGQKIENIEGIWQGTLNSQGRKLRIVFQIEMTEQGTYKGKMDSPDQGARGLAFDSVRYEGNTLILELKLAMLKFEGKLVEDGEKLSGKITQAGYETPLNMVRILEAPTIVRPQDPKKPYPYKEEEVSYRNQKDGIKLTGTLTYPNFEEDNPFPAVLLISGSGAQDRNEEVMGHRPFLVLADHLTRNGIAVLRVDDRGVGGSAGYLYDSTSVDLAQDVIAGVNYLKKRREIDSNKIGLIGHSEGGLIAPIVAVQDDSIAFIVLMAGTGLPGEDILYLQSRLIAEASGVNPNNIEQYINRRRTLYSVLKSDDPDDEIRKTLKEMFMEDLKSKTEAEKKAMGEPNAAFEAQMSYFMSRWFRFFLSYDPTTYLKKVKCPVLAINGEKDLQVPAKENLNAIMNALKEAENSQVTIKEIPGLNHMFQQASLGIPSEYMNIDETINPEVLTFISNWILETINKN